MRYLNLVLVVVLFTQMAFGATYLPGDAVRSPDRTKIWTMPAATDTLTGRASTDTLTNKSMSGATNTFTAIPYGALSLSNSLVPGDLSATFALPLAKLAPSTAGYNAYFASGTGLLTSEQYVAKVRGGLGVDATNLTFPTTGTLATLTGTETFTNHALSDSTTSVVDVTDATKKIIFDAGGTTATTTTITGAQTASRVLTLPDATDTLVGRATTDTLTNKVYNGGAASATNRIKLPSSTLATLTGLTRNAGDITYATDTLKAYIDNGSSLTAIGSGSGAAIEYVTNPDAETNATGWNVYNDGAVATPVDGTGGTATVTFTRVTTAPILRGAGSFAFTKPASNVQGQGFSTDFTIAPADRGRVLNVNSSFTVDSGTFASGDMTFWIYDITGAVLIPLTPNLILPVATQSIVQLQPMAFQTNIASTSYRLIGHVASTSAVAYTLKYDDMSVAPPSKTVGPLLTDNQSFTPVIGNLGTGGVASSTMQWHREGSEIVFFGSINKDASAGSGTSAVTVSLPSGVTLAGSFNGLQIGAASYASGLASVASGGSSIQFSTNTNTPITGANVAANSFILYSGRAQVIGWGSSQQLSSDGGTRRIDFTARKSSGTIPNAAATDIVAWDEVADPTGSFNNTTGEWNAPQAGTAQVKGVITYGGNATGRRVVQVMVNGVLKQATQLPSASGTFAQGVPYSFDVLGLKANDKIKLQAYQDSGAGLALTAALEYNTLSITMVQGPQQIAATESVSARYTTAAGQSIATGAPQTVLFGTKDYDTHNAYNTATGTYTCPVAGKYQVNAVNLYEQASWTAASQANMYIYKNGAAYSRRLTPVVTAGTYYVTLDMNDDVSCLAGETLQIRIDHSEAAARALNTGAVLNRVQFKRVGNY